MAGKDSKKQAKSAQDGGIPDGTFNLPPRLLAVGEILLRKRINPISKAIEEAKKIPSPSAAYKAWLDIAEFVYSKPKPSVETPLSAVQSKISAQSAFKLLSQLEDGIKQSLKTNAPKTEESVPPPNAEKPL